MNIGEHSNDMSSNVTLYGERGIVFGLVLDIAEHLDRVRDVLLAIDWCSSADTYWIEEITDVHFIVEPSFGQFGQPDLLVVCSLGDQSHRILFIETKTTCYEASAKSNATGMVSKTSFNSSINGQLSLDYRFAFALSSRGEQSYWVVEPQALFEQYSRCLKETAKGPRKLKKSLTLRTIVDRWLRELHLSHCFFVALTRDAGLNPLKQAEDDKKPLLLDEGGRNVWQQCSKQFGFLSLEKLDREILDVDGFFHTACRTYIGDWSRATRHRDFEGRQVPMVHWREFPDEFRRASTQLARRIEEETVPWATSDPCVKGSFTFLVNGKRVGKLVPENPDLPSLLVGFSYAVDDAQDFAEQLRDCEPCKYGVKWEPFLMVEADPTTQGTEIVERMVAFLEHVHGLPRR